eukprot:6855245-Pyramimonas_sp.AAC.1
MVSYLRYNLRGDHVRCITQKQVEEMKAPSGRTNTFTKTPLQAPSSQGNALTGNMATENETMLMMH